MSAFRWRETRPTPRVALSLREQITHDRTAEVVRQLVPHGFETFQVSFGRSVGDAPVERLADAIRVAGLIGLQNAQRVYQLR